MHTFEAVEPGVNQCAVALCGLPEGNKRHTRVTIVRDHPTAVVATHLDREVAAAFHDLWGTEGPRAQVFYQVVIAGSAGVTDDELMHRPDLAGMPSNTVRPRRVELAQSGLIVRATAGPGKLIKRDTTTGTPAQVWVVSAAARSLARAAVAKEQAA